MVSRRVKFARRWKRAGIGLRVSVFLLGAIFLSLLFYLQLPHEESLYGGANLLFLGLVNLNVIILLALAFLIGRNVVKLVFDRKRKILGSKIRMRLVVAFIGLAMVPTIILFSLASGLLTQAMEGWFSSQVENTVSESVALARSHYGLLEKLSADIAGKLAEEIRQKPLIFKDQRVLENYLEELRKGKDLFGIRLFDDQQELIIEVTNAAAVIENFSEPQPESGAVRKALQKESTVLREEKEASQFIRAYFPTEYQGSSAVLMISRRLDPDIVNAFNVVNDSYREYEQLKLFKDPLKSGYLLTLTMITFLILFSAIWIGFYMAKEISVPIQKLAEGTKAVARGDYDFKLRETGDDEISFLVRSFNRMTDDLKQSRGEAERRRAYIEAILSQLVVGVIGVDGEHRITSINLAAAKLFGFDQVQGLQGRALEEVIPAETIDQVSALLTRLDQFARPTDILELEISVLNNEGERKVVCTVGRILSHGGSSPGVVLIFDDITDLVKAQQMSAWREVARRIAHEIKNPLTPIQLSAQRLERLFRGQNVKMGVRESTQTIVENVNSIKRLADEFSNFARMPTAEFELSSLNFLISDTISPFAEEHPDIVFQFIADHKMPEVPLDREQIRRMIINLIDNAIAALQQDQENQNTERPCITVKSYYYPAREIVGFEVVDNGPGISGQQRNRIFEPYFTTKKKGTGLGLAIVNSIIADHQGAIRLYRNTPRGVKFVIELPLRQTTTTQRKFAV